MGNKCCLLVKGDYSSRLWSPNSWIDSFSRCIRFKQNGIPRTEWGMVYSLGGRGSLALAGNLSSMFYNFEYFSVSTFL